MRRRLRLPAHAAAVAAGLLTALGGLVPPSSAPRAQDTEDGGPPPARLPPSVRLDGVPLRLTATPLNLPAGFGVAAARHLAAGAVGGAAAGGTALAPVVSRPPPATAPVTVTLATRPIDEDSRPPDRLPADARLGAGMPLRFNVAGLVDRVTNLTTSAAAIGGGPTPTDLGGMSVREEGGGLRFTLGADVLFDFDKANLRREADPILRKLVEQVRAEVPRARYSVEGHTDAKGSDAYNLGLSNRRARSVRDWLVKQGAAASRAVATVGFGENIPVAPNEHPDGSDDPEGRQKNRRVEIVVTPLP